MKAIELALFIVWIKEVVDFLHLSVESVVEIVVWLLLEDKGLVNLLVEAVMVCLRHLLNCRGACHIKSPRVWFGPIQKVAELSLWLLAHWRVLVLVTFEHLLALDHAAIAYHVVKLYGHLVVVWGAEVIVVSVSLLVGHILEFDDFRCVVHQRLALLGYLAVSGLALWMGLKTKNFICLHICILGLPLRKSLGPLIVCVILRLGQQILSRWGINNAA